MKSSHLAPPFILLGVFNIKNMFCALVLGDERGRITSIVRVEFHLNFLNTAAVIHFDPAGNLLYPRPCLL
jgi:hypothetical protein